MSKNPDSVFQFEIPFAIEAKAQIYALVDPRTKEIRYVGKAADPQLRLRGHMEDSKLRKIDKRRNWLKSLKDIGLTPSIVILECVPESEWQACEKKWIAHFRSAGTNLTNMQDGGKGQSKGFKPSPESIEMSASKRRGRKRSPEVVKRITDLAIARRHKMPIEQVKTLRAAHKNWWKKMAPDQQLAKMQKMRAAGIERMAKANTSGQVGVSWSQERQKRVAAINIGGKPIPLGRFLTFTDAVAARREAEQRLHGEFARAA